MCANSAWHGPVKQTSTTTNNSETVNRSDLMYKVGR